MRSGVVLFAEDRDIDNGVLAYRFKEAAKVLGVGTGEFQRLIEAGEIPYVYHGAQRRYLRKDLQSFWDRKEKHRGILESTNPTHYHSGS